MLVSKAVSLYSLAMRTCARLLIYWTCAAPAFAATVYTDPDLNIGDYSILQGGSANASVTFFNAGGAFTAVRTIGSGGGFIGFAAINSNFFYDPSMGSLASIDVSARLTTVGDLWALYILQGPNLYRAAVPIGAGMGQTSSATGRVPANFGLVDLAAGTILPGAPDFSSAFTLGFGQRFSSEVAFVSTITFDDLTITLNTVPEPSTAAALMLGMAALIGIGHRRRHL